MNPDSVDKTLADELRKLTPDQKARVLGFVQSIPKSLPRGTPGRSLLRFAGVIGGEEGRAMLAVIDEQCEKVNADE